MILGLLLLITISFKDGRAEKSDMILKIQLSEILKTNISTCNNLKRIFDIEQDLKFNDVFQKVTNLLENNVKLQPKKYILEKPIFGETVELLLNTTFQTLFKKLLNIRNDKLKKVVLTLQKEDAHSYEYRLLRAFDTSYNSKKRQTKNSSCAEKQNYYHCGYFEYYLTKAELRSHARSLICTFLKVANYTNDFQDLQELLRSLELILQDSNSSSAMLIFANELRTAAMEAECDPGRVYKTLLFNYVINQLKTVEPFNTSELLTMQNKSDLEIKNNFEKLKNSNPRGILTLALDWRIEMQNALEKSKNVSEYFHALDETFKKVVENRNTRIIPTNEISVSLNTTQFCNRTNQQLRLVLVKEIAEKLQATQKGNIREGFLLTDLKELIENENTSIPLLQFVKEYLSDVNLQKKSVMSRIYKYIAEELTLLHHKRVNEYLINVFFRMTMEEMAAILDEFISKDPGSVITTTFDWLFELKLQLITLRKGKTLIDILRNSLEEVKKRRTERIKGDMLRSSFQLNQRIITKSREIKLDAEDFQKFHNALGM